MKSKKVFIELQEGEMFEVDQPPPVGNWKELNDMSLNDWIKLVSHLRDHWQEIARHTHLENQELKKELYMLREGTK